MDDWAAIEEAYQQRVREFHDLPRRISNALGRAGYQTRVQIARASDMELLHKRCIGSVSLCHIRKHIPYAPLDNVLPPPVQLVACKHCGGTGWVPEPEVAK